MSSRPVCAATDGCFARRELAEATIELATRTAHPSDRRWSPARIRCQRVLAEHGLTRGGQRGDVLIDGREAGPHGVDAQMRGAGVAPGRDLLIDRR
jgi:hypothetical protein